MIRDLFIKPTLLLLASVFFWSGVLTLEGINPNIPLIFFILFFLTYKNKNKFLLFVLLLLFFLLFAYFLSGTFFIRDIIFFMAILFVLFFVERILSGHWYIDGLILVLAYSIVFYGGEYLIFSSPLLAYKVFGEIMYNYILIIALGLLLKIRNK